MNILRFAGVAGAMGLLAACSSPYESCTEDLPQDALPDSLWLESLNSNLSDEQLLACEEALLNEDSAPRLERILYALGTRLANDVRSQGFEAYSGTKAADLYISASDHLQDAIETADTEKAELAYNIWSWSTVLDQNLTTSLLFLKHFQMQPSEESHPKTLENWRQAEWPPARLYALHEFSHLEDKPDLSAEERKWLLSKAVTVDPRVALHVGMRFELPQHDIAAMGRQGLEINYDRDIWGVTASALYSYAREQEFDESAVDAALEFMRAYSEAEVTLPKAAALRWGVLEHIRHGDNARALELFRVSGSENWIRPFAVAVNGGPEHVIRKDATVCMSYQSLVRVRAIQRANNPYVSMPDDCTIAHGALPLQSHEVIGGEFVKGFVSGVGEIWMTWSDVETLTRMPSWPE